MPGLKIRAKIQSSSESSGDNQIIETLGWHGILEYYLIQRNER